MPTRTESEARAMTTPIDHPPIILQASAGQAVQISLDAMPGAGMQWQAPPAPPGCTLTDAGFGEAGAGVGGAVQQRFVLTCAGPGAHTLRFDYKRPWEDTVRARQTVQVKVG